jgi:hypothetical protein
MATNNTAMARRLGLKLVAHDAPNHAPNRLPASRKKPRSGELIDIWKWRTRRNSNHTSAFRGLPHDNIYLSSDLLPPAIRLSDSCAIDCIRSVFAGEARDR